MEDLRVIKTHTALADALLNLLNKSSFDDIKVVDICNEAMVHRTTFYKHFEDKYQLLNYVINDIINRLMENLPPVSSFETPSDFYSSLLKNTITYIHQNRKKFKLVIKNNSNGMFLHTMQDIISKHILEFLGVFEQRGYRFSVPLPLIAHYRSGGMIAVAYYLLESNSSYDIEETYAYMINLFYETPYHK